MRRILAIAALCLCAAPAAAQEPTPTQTPAPAQPATQDAKQAERERKEREKQEAKAAKMKAEQDAKAAKEAERRAKADAKAAQTGAAGEKVGMSGNAEQELTQLTDQYIAALKGKDASALERLWADDLTFITPGGVAQTKAQRLADIQSGATKFETLDAGERTFRVYGDAAVMTTLTTVKGQYAGQEASGQYRVTQVWARRGGAWQIVAIQMTRAGQQ